MFEVEKEVAMFWQDGVHVVVGKVKGGPHDSCGNTHGSADKLRVYSSCSRGSVRVAATRLKYPEGKWSAHIVPPNLGGGATIPCNNT